MLEKLDKCNICPHQCKVNRNQGKIGRCKATEKIKIALYSTHNFEEPCISGEKGSGTIFFSNCNLNCVFCQNYEISQLGKGKDISIEELANIFLKQQEKNVENINLVTPTSYIPQIIEAIKRYKKMWDEISQMFLIGSLSGITVLGDVTRKYLPVNLILLFILINMGIMLLRIYLRKKFYCM